MKLFKTFSFALLLACVCFAWQPPEKKFPVRAVAVKGNQNLTLDQVVGAAGIKTGDMVGKAEMDAGLQKLLACGYFDRAAYRFEPRDQGYALEWDVNEVTIFYPIAFEDIPVKAAEAKKLLKAADPLFGDKIPATQEVLKRYEEELNRALKTSGEDTIRGHLTADDKGVLIALFRPSRSLPTIYRVTFTGNKLLLAEELLPVISAAAVGVVYKDADFREILNFKIRPMYEARGRLKVDFPEIKVVKSKDVNGVDISVKIDEGEEFTLGEIRVAGEGGREQDWLRVGGFRQGVPVNMNEVEEGRRKMENAIKRNGYLDAKVTAKRTINEERKAVDMDMTLDPGEAYTFDKLDIKGLDLISEPAVRKAWTMKRGAPFNPDYADTFLAKLREDGIFDNLGDTKAIPDVDRELRKASVTLTFKGMPPEKEKKKPARGPF